MNEMSSTKEKLPDIFSETLQCLVKTFSSKDINDIKAAEAKLGEFENDILSHVKTILLSLVAAKDELTLDLKKSIVIYLKNIIKYRVKADLIPKDTLLDILKSFLDVIISGNLEDNIITNINLTLVDILSCNFITSDTNIPVNLCEILTHYAISKSDLNINTMAYAFKPVISLYQIIVSSKCTRDENIFQVIAKQIEGLEYMIKVYCETENLQNSVEVYVSCHDMVRFIMDYLFISLMKLKKIERINDILPVYVDKFLNFAAKMINKMEMNTTNIQQSIIYFTGNPELDTSMNIMKARSLQFLTHIVQNSKGVLDSLPIDAYSQIATQVISSLNTLVNGTMLAYLSEMSLDSKDFPDNGYDQLIYHMNIFLVKILTIEPFITHFSPLSKQFAVDILLPLLSLTKQDYLQMQLHGENYFRFLNDLINRKVVIHYKTSASYLLSKLCEKYDDLSNFVISFCLQMLDFGLNEAKEECINDYPLLKQNMNCKMLKCSIESLIDTGMLVICILSNFLLANKHLCGILKNILESNQEKLHNINSILIVDKLCAVYGLFLERIVCNEDIGQYFMFISLSFEFLFSYLIKSKEYPCIAFHAADSLNRLMSSKYFSFILSDIVRKFLPLIISSIKEIEVDTFFDLINDIIVFLYIDTDDMLRMCKQATDRILIEAKSSTANAHAKYNIYISKCFHMLSNIVARINLSAQATDEGTAVDISTLEKILEPVVMYIKNPARIEFDDEIVSILGHLMRRSGSVTPLIKNIFIFLSEYIHKQEGMTEELFELLNLILTHDENYQFLLSGDNMKTFCEVIQYGLHEVKGDSENSSVLSGILLQIFLSAPWKSLPEQVVSDLISLVIIKLLDLESFYKDDIDELNFHFDLYIFATFVAALYSAMIGYPYIIFKKLCEQELFTKLLAWTNMFAVIEFFSVVQSKMVVLGICAFLSDQMLFPKIVPLIPKLLSLCFGIIAKQQREESKNLKKLMEKEVECNFVDKNDDNLDEDEDDLNFSSKPENKIDSKEKDLEPISDDKLIFALINRGVYPTKKLDEYEIFSQTLQGIAKADEKAYISWLSLLSPEEKQILNETAHTRRIKFEFNEVKIDIPRRTVKLKRSMENKESD